MKTLSQHNAAVQSAWARLKGVPVGVACDRCGTELIDRPGITCPTGGIPVECPKCGARGVLLHQH
ncbi:MAG TPA: hypothetical protein VK196_03995 [Magnetospirillum sp.]|nr:hypothetical protein [Magnetospirillum sp.]